MDEPARIIITRPRTGRDVDDVGSRWRRARAEIPRGRQWFLVLGLYVVGFLAVVALVAVMLLLLGKSALVAINLFVGGGTD